MASTVIRSRSLTRLIPAAAVALVVGALLTPSATAQQPRPLIPEVPYAPGHGFELAPQQPQTPDRPGFWGVGDSTFRLVSPFGATRPVHCSDEGGRPFGRCWQVAPGGQFVELRRDARVNDLWNSTFTATGSTTSAYIGLYDLAQWVGWQFTSGGIYVPPLTPGSAADTYSTMMPLSPHSPSRPFDVWVYPDAAPGS